MTKKIHPAESTRKLVGAAAGLALVGMVTGFQLSAHAQEQPATDVAKTQNTQNLEPNVATAPSPEQDIQTPPVAEQPQQTFYVDNAPQQTVPQQPAPAAPAPELVAPAPVNVAPQTPVNGTTAGSGG